MTQKQEAQAAGLMLRAQHGEEEAYAELLVLLTAATRSYVRSRVGSLVPWIDDAVQETLATLVRMLRDAAPLQATWTAGFAGLASLAVGALGAQFVCSNDAAAHHLLWHFTPVVLLTVTSIAVGSSLLGRPHRQEPDST